MRRLAAAAAVLLITAFAAAPVAAQSAGRAQARRAAAPPPGSRLTRSLDSLLDAPPFEHALWGVAIEDPSGRRVFERNADRLFVPASNAKLVVAAAATLLLPPDFRFRTSVYTSGTIAGGVLQGDLVLYGRGDPTLSDRFYPTRYSAFEELADSLRAHGVTRVEGDLVGDASYFDSATIRPSWDSYDLAWWYAAPVTALGFNDNSADFLITPAAPGLPPLITFEPDLGLVQFTNRARTVPVDSPRTIDFHRAPGTNAVWADGDVPADTRPWTENVSVADGPLWTATAFRHALESHGVTVSGRTRTTFDPSAHAAARLTEALAEHRSPPIGRIIEPVLRMSHNWYAELLLRTLGKERTGAGGWDSGLAVERRFLIDSLGADSTEFSLADGSGLSHANLVTPRVFVRILEAIRRRPRAASLRSALPVAGVSGTLRTRYRGSGLAGRVRAKTGSIANTNTLSGYLDTPQGTWTFSIALNNHAEHGREALKRIDAIVAMLARRAER
jgi:D-alanyl-D-alanine carboxypeptidase/D-alanyl-D-alanine-endopeptidase (penicillin-binding protein 4)